MTTEGLTGTTWIDPDHGDGLTLVTHCRDEDGPDCWIDQNGNHVSHAGLRNNGYLRVAVIPWQLIKRLRATYDAADRGWALERAIDAILDAADGAS